MKKLFLICFSLAASTLFGFDIQAVDLTEEGRAKSALPYRMAEDGKKIYKDIGKTIEALNGQTIEALNGQTMELMDVKIIYPIDSNKTHKPTALSNKKKKTEAQEDITSVFADINAKQESEIEAINDENKQIKLNNEVKKSTPVNLEK